MTQKDSNHSEETPIDENLSTGTPESHSKFSTPSSEEATRSMPNWTAEEEAYYGHKVDEEESPEIYNHQMIDATSFLDSFQVNEKENRVDAAFDSMSKMKRTLLFSCLLALSVMIIGLIGIFWYCWETIQVEKGQSTSTVSFIVSGFGAGSIFGLLFLRKLLLTTSRRKVWVGLLSTYLVSMYALASINYFLDISLVYDVVCFSCLFIVGSTQMPIRTLSMSTTTKLYPKSANVMLQVYSISILLGSIIGPLTSALFLRVVGFPVIIYAYATLIFIIMIIGAFIMPNTTPQAQNNDAVSIWMIVKTYRGFTNILTEFFTGLILRYQINGMALYANEKYGFTPVGTSYLIDVNSFFAVVFLFVTIFLVKKTNHRFVMIGFALVSTGFGYLIIGGLFLLENPPLSMTMAGFIITQFGMCGQACENTDMIVLCQQLSGKEEVPIALKDAASVLIMFMFSLSTFLGSFSLGILLKYISYQTLMKISSIILICLSANYFLATRGRYSAKKTNKRSKVLIKKTPGEEE